MKEFIEKLIARLEEISVSRDNDGVINGCNMGICEDDDCLKCLKKKVISIVNQLAEEYINTSTDTSSGWVACSERLPEEDGNYLVQQDDGRINILHYCKGWNCTYMDVDKTRWSNACERKDIIAWQPLPQPLPQPYKENENGKI